jgi:hypothetical protein
MAVFNCVENNANPLLLFVLDLIWLNLIVVSMFPAVSYIFFIRPALLDQREEVGFTKC